MAFRSKVERQRRRQEAEPLEGCQLILTLCHSLVFYSATLWQQWIANINCLIRSVRSSCTRKRSRLPRRNKSISLAFTRSFASPLAKGKMKVRDFLFQSCLIQKWEFQFPTFAPLLQEREKRPFQCAFVPKQLLNMYIKSRRLVCTMPPAGVS